MDPSTYPFSPRELSIGERKAGDLRLFNSPKLGRRVELLGPLTFLTALRLEFDPHVLGYVERPRMLEVLDRQVELHFWTRERRGLERFWLIVPNDEAIDPTSPRRAHREADAFIDAANRAHINVQFVFEDELVRDATRLTAYRRLLPYVQSAVDLSNREQLRERVRELFGLAPRATIEHVCAELRGFHRADVMASVADLVHAGELALASPVLNRTSVIERRAAHVA